MHIYPDNRHSNFQNIREKKDKERQFHTIQKYNIKIKHKKYNTFIQHRILNTENKTPANRIIHINHKYLNKRTGNS